MSLPAIAALAPFELDELKVLASSVNSSRAALILFVTSV